MRFTLLEPHRSFVKSYSVDLSAFLVSGTVVNAVLQIHCAELLLSY